MAQTVRSNSKTPPPAAPASRIQGALGKLGNLGSLGSALMRPAPAAKPGAKPKGGMTRFFFGMLVLMIGSQVIYYVLAEVISRMGKQVAASMVVSPWPKVPILGGLTPFLMLYILLIALLWWGLYRFNIIPKDPFGVKAQAAARASAAATTTSAGSHKTRADRRHASVATPTPTSKNGKTNNTAKTASTKVSTTRVATVTTSGAARTGVPGSSDRAYQQVRAMQKSRKRRDVKR